MLNAWDIIPQKTLKVAIPDLPNAVCSSMFSLYWDKNIKVKPEKLRIFFYFFFEGTSQKISIHRRLWLLSIEQRTGVDQASAVRDGFMDHFCNGKKRNSVPKWTNQCQWKRGNKWLMCSHYLILFGFVDAVGGFEKTMHLAWKCAL